MAVFKGTLFDLIESEFCRWVQTLLPASIYVYKSYTPTPRPTGPSVTFNIKQIKQIGFDYVPLPANITDNTTKNFGTYELTFGLVSYGGDAIVCMKSLQAIRQGLQDDRYQELYGALNGNFAFMRFSGGCNDISYLQSTTDAYMTRAFSQDIIFSATNIYENVVGEIDEINIEETLYNQQQEIIAQENFSVSI